MKAHAGPDVEGDGMVVEEEEKSVRKRRGCFGRRGRKA